MTPGELRKRRHRPRAAEQTFGGHDDERLSKRLPHLTTQQMEVLSRRRRIADLHVVPGAQLQEPLEPGAGVIGPLSFQCVRKEQHQPASPLPFGLRAGDELVDDSLGVVGEITELSLPDDQRFGAHDGISVFKPQNGTFR